MNYSRFSTAFVTILVILSVVSIKMAFLYGSELLLFLVITIPLIFSIIAFRNISKNDYDH